MCRVQRVSGSLGLSPFFSTVGCPTVSTSSSQLGEIRNASLSVWGAICVTDSSVLAYVESNYHKGTGRYLNTDCRWQKDRIEETALVFEMVRAADNHMCVKVWLVTCLKISRVFSISSVSNPLSSLCLNGSCCVSRICRRLMTWWNVSLSNLRTYTGRSEIEARNTLTGLCAHKNAYLLHMARIHMYTHILLHCLSHSCKYTQQYFYAQFKMYFSNSHYLDLGSYSDVSLSFVVHYVIISTVSSFCATYMDIWLWISAETLVLHSIMHKGRSSMPGWSYL